MERYNDEITRQIAQNTGHPTRLLRALNRRRFVPNSASLADSRTDEDFQGVEDEIDSQE